MNPFPLCPLFVPANKLDWIKKAERSEADGLIIDLEDSVPAEEKNVHIVLEHFNFEMQFLLDDFQEGKITCAELHSSFDPG